LAVPFHFTLGSPKLLSLTNAIGFIVLEVAIGEYGISTDKLIAAVDKSYENQKMIAGPDKATTDGTYFQPSKWP
jgi:hypothetical protein